MTQVAGDLRALPLMSRVLALAAKANVKAKAKVAAEREVAVMAVMGGLVAAAGRVAVRWASRRASTRSGRSRAGRCCPIAPRTWSRCPRSAP